MALYSFIIIIISLVLIIAHIRKVHVFVWWTPEESGLSNYCYYDDGMYCLVPKKVNQFEKTREEYK